MVESVLEFLLMVAGVIAGVLENFIMIFTLENFVIVTTGLASLILFLIAVAIAAFSFFGRRHIEKVIRQMTDESVKKALEASSPLQSIRVEILNKEIGDMVSKKMDEYKKTSPEDYEIYPNTREILYQMIRDVMREEAEKQGEENIKIYPEGQEMYPSTDENGGNTEK